MAPSDHSIRRRTTKSSTTTERASAAEAEATSWPRRAEYKKQKIPKINVEDLLPSTSSTTTTALLLDDDDNTVSSSSGCSTPKAQRFRIPEIVKCPPAPKKQRVVSNCSSLQRNPARPIAFFAPSDLELFFFFAFRDISI